MCLVSSCRSLLCVLIFSLGCCVRFWWMMYVRVVRRVCSCSSVWLIVWVCVCRNWFSVMSSVLLRCVLCWRNSCVCCRMIMFRSWSRCVILWMRSCSWCWKCGWVIFLSWFLNVWNRCSVVLVRCSSWLLVWVILSVCWLMLRIVVVGVKCSWRIFLSRYLFRSSMCVWWGCVWIVVRWLILFCVCWVVVVMICWCGCWLILSFCVRIMSVCWMYRNRVMLRVYVCRVFSWSVWCVCRLSWFVISILCYCILWILWWCFCLLKVCMLRWFGVWVWLICCSVSIVWWWLDWLWLLCCLIVCRWVFVCWLLKSDLVKCGVCWVWLRVSLGSLLVFWKRLRSRLLLLVVVLVRLVVRFVLLNVVCVVWSCWCLNRCSCCLVIWLRVMWWLRRKVVIVRVMRFELCWYVVCIVDGYVGGLFVLIRYCYVFVLLY